MLSESESKNQPRLQSDDLLPPISLWMTLGGLFLVGTCGIAVAVAAFTPYNVTVKAVATIRPAGEQRLVQAATQGTVKEIAVRENQPVQQGDPIATIDDSRLQTQKSQLENNLQQTQQQLDRIDAQQISLDGQIAAEGDRIERVVRAAQAELDAIEREYQDQTITTLAQVREAEASLGQTQAEWQQAQARLRSAQAELQSTEVALNAAITRRDRYQPVAEIGGLSLDRYQEVELAASQQQQTREAQKANVEAQEQEIDRLASAIEAAQARLQGALAAVNPSNARAIVAAENIAQEQANGQVTRSRLNQEREQLNLRRLELQNQLDRDREELQQVETELTMTVIRAPVSGTIQQLSLRNTEQVVNTGDTIAQIAPSAVPLVIKALLPSDDIAKVTTQQRAQMRVSGCPYPDYGVLEGTTREISPDAIAEQQNGANGARRYSITIEPEAGALHSALGRCSIQAGMEGTVDIITREETVLTFILRKVRLMANV